MRRLKLLLACAFVVCNGLASSVAAVSGDGLSIEKGSWPRTLERIFREVLRDEAFRVRLGRETSMRLWLARRIPGNDEVGDSPFRNQRLNYSIAEGALVGVIELLSPWSDSKGQPISPGIYALHYAAQPIMKEHRGVSEFRDFLVFVEPRESKIGGMDLDALIAASQRVSGTNHPAVLSVRPSRQREGAPRLSREDPDLQVLEVSNGTVQLGLVVGHTPEPAEHAHRPPERDASNEPSD